MGISPKVVSRGGTAWFHNSDRNYKKGSIPKRISEAVAKHLSASKLFQSVSSSPTRTQTDLVLQGALEKFEAFKEIPPANMTWVAQRGFGLLGALATAGVQSNYEATTKLSDLQLIEVSTSAVLWQGEVEGRLNGQDYADPDGYSVYHKANMSLKLAVDQLIQKLTEVKTHNRLNNI